MSEVSRDPGYPGAEQVAGTLREGGMPALMFDSSDSIVVAQVSTGYVTLTVVGFAVAESGDIPLAETNEVVLALRVGGIQAIHYWGPDLDTLYANTILTEGPTGVNTIAVALGWPSS